MSVKLWGFLRLNLTTLSHYNQFRSGVNIESLSAGFATPEETHNHWLLSPMHRKHMLGEDSFFARQLEYGIGYAYVPGGDYLHYWVLIIAERGP